ncbi:hypothetical protein [Variovorax sp. AFSI2.2]|uniref:hypothetical protein n=1 Tax=Variovorax sp. AFSI2.2 TaxID=3384160 RepID=UPI003EB86B16
MNSLRNELNCQMNSSRIAPSACGKYCSSGLIGLLGVLDFAAQFDAIAGRQLERRDRAGQLRHDVVGGQAGVVSVDFHLEVTP